MLCLLTSLRAQEGYDITISIENVPDKMLYLAGFYGEDAVMFDSAKVKHKRDFYFKNNKREMPSGIYWLLNNERKVYMELLVDKSRHFAIKTTMDQLWSWREMTNTEENKVFFGYQLRAAYTDDVHALVQEFIDRSPESLLAKYLKAKYMATDIQEKLALAQGESEEPEQQYAWLVEHYFDHIDFSDARLLRTPLRIDLSEYFRHIVIPHPDTLKMRIDRFLARTSTCVETKNYFLHQLYHLFNDDTPEGNAVLVHLYDTYCPGGVCSWLEPAQARVFKRMVDRKRRLLPGAAVPPLEAYDLDGKVLKTKDIAADYIVLWLWDPDCDDCVEQTPKLYEFYQKNRELYNFEVYAISITEDVDRWRAFIEAHHLDWLNVSYGKGEPNYDFADYFDVLTTPGIFLMRKNHTIVASQFPLEDLQDHLFNEMHKSEK
ncbi:MAG: redoxin domain-containing protein [Bacteroidales bacterium]|nr:redoxin domain-containing protein [Bacteroidales bacterium]